MSAPDLEDNLVEYVRFHGALEVLDAVLAVALEIYGDRAKAVEKCHGLLLERAGHLAEVTA